jgi:DeoR family transcriptional regulator, copper-sensing transcriptional repressor
MKRPFTRFVLLGLLNSRGACYLNFHLVLLALIIAISAVSCWAQTPEKCSKCGMDLSKYPHTRYVVLTTDGQEYPTCGVQCGLTLHLRLQDKWKAARATDILSNRSFEALKGFYVHKSSVVTDMAPGFIAFISREHADRFSKGFGGQVVTYEEALDLWKKQMN